MGAIRFRRASPAPLALALVLLAGFAAPAGEPPLGDAPVVWHADDRRDIPQPAVRRTNLMRTGLDATFFRPLGRLLHPGRAVRRVGTLFGGDPAPPAANVNVLDEVPNSSWFTNRIGLFPVTPSEAARGPMSSSGPDASGRWVVVSAKTEGVTPGFNVRDASGTVWVVKFDPAAYPGMASAAGVISGRILHTAGYNAPEDAIVSFRRDQLMVAENVRFTDAEGEERTMREADLDALLARAPSPIDGAWRAFASRFLDGVPLGPFDWRGRRPDDPNDRVPHEHRRELRAFRVFAAWLCHFDTKQENTLDMFVEDDGRQFVRHYVIDFASTLGAGATEPLQTACFEYSIDFGRIFARTATVGFWQDPWRRVARPEGLEEVGYLEADEFDPTGFRPHVPNAAFANLTDRDGYWAAKIISGFTDRHLEAIVAQGRYADPRAAAYVARMLAARRDVIAKHYFDRVAPLDFFAVDRGALRYRDLGIERDVYDHRTTRYRARVAAVTPEAVRATRTPWHITDRPALDLGADPVRSVVDAQDEQTYPFLEVELQVDRGRGWSGSVVVFAARGSGRIVGVRR